MKTRRTQPAYTRAQTTCLILLLVTCALGVGSCSSYWDQRIERQDAAIATYIQANNCVVADFSGRMVRTYRCDLPEAGRYMRATELASQAIERSGT